jgi:hypothetical protein
MAIVKRVIPALHAARWTGLHRWRSSGTRELCGPTTSRPLLSAGWAANHKSMNAATIWTLLSIFVIAPLGALAFDRPCFGNWIWHIDLEKARDYE